jgi:uroporphyrin-III C-methyltransferase/precorrin-2 dehydrogenase/sirohydrochlorin ferrochelatase
MGYPIQLTLDSDARALVVGGGAIALAKLQGLLAAGLRVSLIAREVSPEVSALVSQLALVELRDARAEDVEGYALVIAATDDRGVNAMLASAARARGILVNAVDDPAASTFFAPAVVRRGAVAVTISSDGASPLFSARLRRVLDAVLPDSVSTVSDLFASIRSRGLRGLAQRSRLLRALADPRLGHFVDHADLETAADAIEKIAREPEELFLPGTVAIVGAGPGAKELLTLRALDRIQRADVILHDALVTTEVLDLALPSTRVIDVGRRCAGVEHKGTSVELAIALLIREARSGARVVRLHGGDPFVFGRGGEEADALTAAGIAHEVVPGVSSAFAAASAAGIPLTQRGEARGFTVRTGHSASGRTEAELPAEEETIVVLMGLGGARAILAKFVADGMSPLTPAAAISHATLPTQKVISGTVTDLADRIEAARLESPATLVIGKVARRAKADLALFAKVVAA